MTDEKVSTLEEAKRNVLYYEKPWLKDVDEAISRGKNKLEEKIKEEKRQEEERTAAHKEEIASIAKSWFPSVVENAILKKRRETTLRFDPPDWAVKSADPSNPFFEYDPHLVLSVLKDLYAGYVGKGSVDLVNAGYPHLSPLSYVILRLDLSPTFIKSYETSPKDIQGPWADYQLDEIRLRRGRIVLTNIFKALKLENSWLRPVTLLYPLTSLPELATSAVREALTGLHMFECLSPEQQETVLEAGGRGTLTSIENKWLLKALLMELDAVLQDEAQLLSSEC